MIQHDDIERLIDRQDTLNHTRVDNPTIGDRDEALHSHAYVLALTLQKPSRILDAHRDPRAAHVRSRRQPSRDRAPDMSRAQWIALGALSIPALAGAAIVTTTLGTIGALAYGGVLLAGANVREALRSRPHHGRPGPTYLATVTHWKDRPHR